MATLKTPLQALWVNHRFVSSRQLIFTRLTVYNFGNSLP